MQDSQNLLAHPVERKRCASCQRWGGKRLPGQTRDVVLIESETSTGLCQGGPWNGSERRARCACGHWQCWGSLTPAATTAHS